MTPAAHRIGYVLKVYPRFSETFVVSEILAREAAGEVLDVFSMHRPREGRFHPALADVQGAVTYLDDRPVPDSRTLWSDLRALHRVTPLGAVLDDLLEEDVRDAGSAVELARHVRERGITHLHAHFGTSAATVARRAAALAGVTWSFTAHAKDIYADSVDPADLRAKLADAHHVVTVSDYNLAHLRERFGAAADRVHRVYNGLPLARFPYREPEERPAIDVLGVGRLVPKKGFDDLVRACVLLRDAGRRVRCVIVGSGEEEARLRGLVADLGAEDLVQLAGPLPQDRVRAALADAAVLAAPCVVADDGNADGLPTVILEAMAVGTPVVATPVTGIPEAVVHGTTGTIVPERDPAALAAALAALLEDPAGRRRYAAAGRARVETLFSSDRQAAELRALLPSIREPAATCA